MNKTKLVLIGIGLYFLSTGVSFAVFSQTKTGSGLLSPQLRKNKSETPTSAPEEFSGPRTAVCPMNGIKYPQGQKDAWGEKRPLLVMIENHEDSRPQYGLSRADIIYEAVAEGGVTRFMGIYYCDAVASPGENYEIGPVRSARSYFLDWASEYGDYPLYVHVGGAHCSPACLPGDAPGQCSGPCQTDSRVQALEQIRSFGWLKQGNDMNQFSLGVRQCKRMNSRTGDVRATEHTMYCDSQGLWQKAAERGLDNGWSASFTPWKFKDDPEDSERGNVDEFSFNFWSGYSAYSVSWKYNRENNDYLRENGDQPHEDYLTKEQLSAKNIIVQFVDEEGPVDSLKHLYYDTIGFGDGLLFQDGLVKEVEWSKADRESRTKFTDSSGSEIKFTRGKIWIEILPSGSKVDYETS